jgi:heterodisulfide reductase subunit A
MEMIGVFICHCGINIAGVIDIEEITRYASELPDVKVARNYRYICSDPGQELIRDCIKEFSLAKIVVAACTPKMHERTFQSTISTAGLNPI